MPLPDPHLWQKIKDFELDDPDSSFMFSDRLARENNWTIDYSLRAIDEYKKFMYLLCVGGKPLTPSDQVDQVWHLHLLYTRSYWEDFCGEVLERKIHHGPTRGVEQRGQFTDQYQNLFDLYEQTFDQKPPSDIWPTEKVRFSELHFVRVNKHRKMVLPRPPFFKFRKPNKS